MSKGNATRETILKAGLELASRIGLSAISIGLLAEEVAMSKSGLFAHFNSKEKLQLAILDHAGAYFVEIVLRPALRERRGLPRLRALFEGWARWSETSASGGCIFYAAAVEYDDRPGPVKNRLKGLQKKWISSLEKAIGMAAASGELKKGIDRRQAAFEIYAVMLGYYYFHRLIGDPLAARRRKAAFERVIASYRAGGA